MFLIEKKKTHYTTLYFSHLPKIMINVIKYIENSLYGFCLMNLVYPLWWVCPHYKEQFGEESCHKRYWKNTYFLKINKYPLKSWFDIRKKHFFVIKESCRKRTDTFAMLHHKMLSIWSQIQLFLKKLWLRKKI